MPEFFFGAGEGRSRCRPLPSALILSSLTEAMNEVSVILIATLLRQLILIAITIPFSYFIGTAFTTAIPVTITSARTIAWICHFFCTCHNCCSYGRCYYYGYEDYGTLTVFTQSLFLPVVAITVILPSSSDDCYCCCCCRQLQLLPLAILLMLLLLLLLP